VQKYIKAGTAHVAVGDALKKDDIRKVLTASTYDFILFSIGASADSDLSLSSSLAHLPTLPPRHTGLIFKLPVPTINPPDLCGSSMRVFLKVFRTMPEEVKATKLIVISSSGLGRKGHEALPLLMKPMYGWMLQVPHVDKLVMERLIGRAAGQPTWGEDSPAEADEVDEQPWLNVAVIRPAFLTDGECQGENDKKRRPGKQPYRVGELLPSAYIIARKDIAHFITEQVIPQFDKYKGRAVDVSY